MEKVTKEIVYSIPIRNWIFGTDAITLTEKQAIELRDELMALLVDTGK